MVCPETQARAIRHPTRARNLGAGSSEGKAREPLLGSLIRDLVKIASARSCHPACIGQCGLLGCSPQSLISVTFEMCSVCTCTHNQNVATVVHMRWDSLGIANAVSESPSRKRLAAVAGLFARRPKQFPKRASQKFKRIVSPLGLVFRCSWAAAN